MDISHIIGENLKRLRSERDLSLGGLSELSGVSKVLLSQMEKGESNPSIHTIWKIADALELPYTALLEQHVEGGAMVAADSLSPQSLDGGQGELYCYYSHTQDRRFELFRMIIAPRGIYVSQGHGKRTDEYALVERGVLELVLDDGPHVLKEADAIRFHSDKRHIYRNAGGDVLELVIVNYYR